MLDFPGVTGIKLLIAQARYAAYHGRQEACYPGPIQAV